LPEKTPILPLVLLVDDNQDDVLLIKRSFARAGLEFPIANVSSGLECMAYLSGEHPYHDRMIYPMPSLVLLDIRMPGTNGFDVLRWIRHQPVFASLRVVVLTSSDDIREVTLAFQLGATSFLVKPLDFWYATQLCRSLRSCLQFPEVPHSNKSTGLRSVSGADASLLATPRPLSRA